MGKRANAAACFMFALLLSALPAAADEAAPAPSRDLLRGKVTSSPSPFLHGSIQTVAPGTKLDLILTGNLNSEVSQKGEEVLARIAADVRDGERVLMPGGWYAHGIVTDIQGQRRLGRDGFVEIEFDTIVSPDGAYELPFKARLSTKDNQLKAVAKTLAVDAGFVTAGAAGGALLSVQMTGIPLAVATEGYSVAIGAGVGAGIGAIGALKRKGKIASFYPGDTLKLTIAEPITMPGFNPALLPSAQRGQDLAGLAVAIDRTRFQKDPFGDARARLLTVDLTLTNNTGRSISLFDLAVVSDHNQRYYPSVLGNFAGLKKKIEPNSTEAATVSFSVDTGKRKYWLVVLEKGSREELKRVPIN